MGKIKYFFVSKDADFKFRQESADDSSVCFEYFENNKKPLAVVFNSILNSRDIGDCDYVAFVHADVECDFRRLSEHIMSLNGKYDVIGLCGCARLCVSKSPLNWYTGSEPFPQCRWGCVSHGELGGQVSFFSQHHENVTDHEVACIDGLCIVLSRKAIDLGLRFDETLGSFSHYDTDISLQAILKYGLKVGVVVRKELKHYSVGKSILTKQFLADETLFRNKWNFGRPV